MAKTNHRYDAADCAVALNSVPVTEWAPGSTFISGAKSNNYSESSSDSFGNGKTAISHDSSGTITFDMDPFSDVYQDVLRLGGSLKEVPISVTTPVEHMHAEHATLQNLPPVEYGSGYPTRSVVFSCSDYQVDPIK